MGDLLIFFLFLAGVMVFTIVIANNVMRKRDVDQMKDLVSGKTAGTVGGASAAPGSLMKAEHASKRDRVAKLVLGRDLNQKLRDLIEQAGMDWDPARTMLGALFLAVAGFNLFWYIVPRGQAIAVIGVIAGGGAPFLFIYTKRKKRLLKFEEQFPDALEFVARTMRSGHAFSVSLEMMHKELPRPQR